MTKKQECSECSKRKSRADEQLRIHPADVGKMVDLFWAVADVYNTEKHLEFSLMKIRREMQDEKKDQKLEEAIMVLLNKVRIIRASLLKKLLGDMKIPFDLWCLPKGSYVYSNPTIKTVEELTVGEKVLTIDGMFNEISEIFTRKISEEIIVIEPYYTNIPLKLTKEHPVLVASSVRRKQKDAWRNKNDFKFVWKFAKDITEDDMLVFPRIKEVEVIDYIPIKIYGRKPTKYFIDMFPINKDTMYLIGLYLGDGSTTTRYRKNRKPYYCTYFSYGSKKKHLLADTINILDKYFGIKLHVVEGRTCTDVRFNSKALCTFFKEHFGGNCYEKKIPQWVFKLPNELIAMMLKGLIATDGHISKYFITISTSSKSLAFSLRLLLFKLGILHTLMMSIRDNYSIVDGRKIKQKVPLYTLQVSGDSARDLANLIGVEYDGGEKTSGNFGLVLNDFILIPIRRVYTEFYDGFVYNFSVPNTQTYTTHTAIVHNCNFKHMTGATMQIMEVATRDIYKGDYESAKEYTDLAYELWHTFWEIYYLIKFYNENEDMFFKSVEVLVNGVEGEAGGTEEEGG